MSQGSSVGSPRAVLSKGLCHGGVGVVAVPHAVSGVGVVAGETNTEPRERRQFPEIKRYLM